MVVMQVGLSMVLLTGAGLFAPQSRETSKRGCWFRSGQHAACSASIRVLAGYKPTELATLYQQLLDRVGFNAASPLRFDGDLRADEWHAPNRAVSRSPGYTPQPGEDLVVEDVLTGPKYAETLGVPLLRGREIEIRDTASAPRIAVVNETFAEHYFKDQNPIGRTFTFDDETDSGAPLEIIGVIGDIKSGDAREKPTAGGLSSDSANSGTGCVYVHHSHAHDRRPYAARRLKCGR